MTFLCAAQLLFRQINTENTTFFKKLKYLISQKFLVYIYSTLFDSSQESLLKKNNMLTTCKLVWSDHPVEVNNLPRLFGAAERTLGLCLCCRSIVACCLTRNRLSELLCGKCRTTNNEKMKTTQTYVQ